ncbi:DUF3298 domain-containing protein [Mycolicibacterium holsaticum]|uniref:DUF3298 domain-containing protein n=1 Tax=Mycolicibacterium holsaticum TaxID=152142 RepID=UPI001C7D539B|nr:DUF3298 domain-containing protein [Mycolicibacterium holsaticum]MDA4108139.1 hypothetical protein [Mycolicibacterium holsaticum DSM 44478 = JCM 12374]QZA14450.1 DUF3298 domain-containing protein [Mycolicibacterium holsaticum DSM 44478 = JCM 12374]UNC08101.1 DUF3298 domain-containing protein [Mycolicibacterium holsaticum DSM 44478 = JCM 12374]
MSRVLARWAGPLLAITLVGLLVGAAPTADADAISNGVTYTVVPDVRAGVSPQGPGEWTVNYEKLAGGNPAVTDAINRILDDEADGQVWLFAASASKSSRWVFNTDGRLLFRPMTISALFKGQYNAFDLPNMPVDTVATRVFDSRSGIQIVWGNLFVDEQAGLNRLGELTKQILPATYPTPPLGGWGEYYAGWAPVQRNFRFWIPTDAGLQIHFPEGQFGREVRSITVPWAAVTDLIDPVFAPITS